MLVGMHPAVSVVAVVALLAGVPTQGSSGGIDRWSTTGPGAGTVLAIATSAIQHDVVYAGVLGAYPAGLESGVYKSTDGGRSWHLNSVGLDNRYVTEVGVAPSLSDVVYIGTDGDGVYATIDGGRRWIHTNWPSPTINSVMAMAVDPLDSKTVYASAEYTDEPYGSGLFRTTDGGRSWTDLSIDIGYQYVYALAVDPANPTTVYAGTGGDGMYKSTDGGTTWFPSNEGMGVPTVTALAVDPQHPSTLYAGANAYDAPKDSGIFKSTDAGQTWSLLDMTAFGEYRNALDLAIDPDTTGTLYASAQTGDGSYEGGGVFKSADGGESWAAVHQGLFDAKVWGLAIDPTTPSTLYAGASNGVSKSVDGAGSWFWASRGVLAATAKSLALDGSAVYVGTDSAGVFRSSDAGVQWVLARKGLTGDDLLGSLAADPLAPGTLYAGTLGRGVYRSTNGGARWVPVNVGLTDRNVRSVAVDGTSRVYAGTDDGVFESLDGGGHWRSVLRPYVGWVVSVVAADPTLPDAVYAAGWYDAVYKSTDGGATWALKDDGIGDETQLAFAVDPTDSNVLYLGAFCENPGERCIFKSSDGGASWHPMHAGVSRTGVGALAIDPNDPSIVYAGSQDHGVFRSADGGSSWLPFNLGLRNLAVNAIAVDSASTVYAATEGSGVFVCRFG